MPRLVTQLTRGHHMRIGEGFVCYRGTEDGMVRLECVLPVKGHFRIGDAILSIERVYGCGNRAVLGISAPPEIEINKEPTTRHLRTIWPAGDSRYVEEGATHGL